MAYDDTTKYESRIWTMVLLCLTTIILGAFVLAYKSGSCAPTIEVCHDKFIPADGTNTMACPPGATGDVIMSPPAAHSGVMCHCNNKPASSTSN